MGHNFEIQLFMIRVNWVLVDPHHPVTLQLTPSMHLDHSNTLARRRLRSHQPYALARLAAQDERTPCRRRRKTSLSNTKTSLSTFKRRRGRGFQRVGAFTLRPGSAAAAHAALRRDRETARRLARIARAAQEHPEAMAQRMGRYFATLLAPPPPAAADVPASAAADPAPAAAAAGAGAGAVGTRARTARV